VVAGIAPAAIMGEAEREEALEKLMHRWRTGQVWRWPPKRAAPAGLIVMVMVVRGGHGPGGGVDRVVIEGVAARDGGPQRHAGSHTVIIGD
jgi:hypothetical protein